MLLIDVETGEDNMLRTGVIAALAWGLAAIAPAQEGPPTLKVAVQASGTVNWEIQTILNNGFDDPLTLPELDFLSLA